jgi:hypothetical protein
MRSLFFFQITKIIFIVGVGGRGRSVFVKRSWVIHVAFLDT